MPSNARTFFLKAAALGVLLMAAAPGVAMAQEPKHSVRLTYPDRIGDLVFKEVQPQSEKDRATQLHYKAPGIVLTIYIYGGGPDLPDGIDSPELDREFTSAKQAVHSPKAWKKAKDVREGKADLGTPPNVVPAREAVFKVQGDDLKANSYLYLTAQNHVFFKVRCTSSLKKKDEEKNLAAIRAAVGDIVHKAFALEPKPPDDAPPPPPPTSSTTRTG